MLACMGRNPAEAGKSCGENEVASSEYENIFQCSLHSWHKIPVI